MGNQNQENNTELMEIENEISCVEPTDVSTESKSKKKFFSKERAKGAVVGATTAVGVCVIVQKLIGFFHTKRKMKEIEYEVQAEMEKDS